MHLSLCVVCALKTFVQSHTHTHAPLSVCCVRSKSSCSLKPKAPPSNTGHTRTTRTHIRVHTGPHVLNKTGSFRLEYTADTHTTWRLQDMACYAIHSCLQLLLPELEHSNSGGIGRLREATGRIPMPFRSDCSIGC
jgi:hypothetical protein